MHPLDLWIVSSAWNPACCLLTSLHLIADFTTEETLTHAQDSPLRVRLSWPHFSSGQECCAQVGVFDARTAHFIPFCFLCWGFFQPGSVCSSILISSLILITKLLGLSEPLGLPNLVLTKVPMESERGTNAQEHTAFVDISLFSLSWFLMFLMTVHLSLAFVFFPLPFSSLFGPISEGYPPPLRTRLRVCLLGFPSSTFGHLNWSGWEWESEWAVPAQRPLQAPRTCASEWRWVRMKGEITRVWAHGSHSISGLDLGEQEREPKEIEEVSPASPGTAFPYK